MSNEKMNTAERISTGLLIASAVLNVAAWASAADLGYFERDGVLADASLSQPIENWSQDEWTLLTMLVAGGFLAASFGAGRIGKIQRWWYSND